MSQNNTSEYTIYYEFKDGVCACSLDLTVSRASNIKLLEVYLSKISNTQVTIREIVKLKQEELK